MLPDTAVSIADYSFWAYHYNDKYTPPQIATSARSKSVIGQISIEFEEVQPLLGQRLLRGSVRLVGVEPFNVMMIRLRNEDDRFAFAGWTQDSEYFGATLCAQVPRDDGQQIMLAVSSNDEEGIANRVLGSFQINVMTDDPIVFDDDDFALVSADVLSIDNTEHVVYGNGAQGSFSRLLIPPKFVNELAQNYPNPFNPQTVIAYSLAQRSEVRLTIYDVAGRRVRELANERRAPGVHRAVWDGRDGSGARVASGVYFCKLVAGSFEGTKKMTLLK